MVSGKKADDGLIYLPFKQGSPGRKLLKCGILKTFEGICRSPALTLHQIALVYLYGGRIQLCASIPCSSSTVRYLLGPAWLEMCSCVLHVTSKLTTMVHTSALLTSKYTAYTRDHAVWPALLQITKKIMSN